MCSILIRLLLVILLFCNVYSNERIIYKRIDFEDYIQLIYTDDSFYNYDSSEEDETLSTKIDISQCSNLPSDFSNNVLSVNTQNLCVRLFNGAQSSGNFIEIMSRSPSHDDLRKWNFGDKTKSVGPCPDQCSPEIIGNSTSNIAGGIVTIFTLPDYKDSYISINLTGRCTPVPKSFINDVSSIQTNGQCIQLYNTENCQLTGDNVDTIELRKGIPFLNEIKKNWHFTKTRAISHCSYKCNILSTDSMEDELEVFPIQGEAILYNTKNFEGNHLKVNISVCLNLTGYWERLAQSVKIGNDTCIELYDSLDCVGENLIVNSSVTNLSTLKFDGRTRSISECFSGNDSTVGLDLNSVTTLDSKESTQQLADMDSKNKGHLPAVVTFVGIIIVAAFVEFVIFIFRFYKKRVEIF